MNQQMSQKSLGLNVVGHVKGEYGLGQALRSNIQAFEAVDIPFGIYNFDVPWHSNQDSTYDNFTKDNPYPINFVHVNPDPSFYQKIGTDFFREKYNIGFWAWELTKLSPYWNFAFDFFDEIWTPSNYSGEAISSVSPVPVFKVPHSIDLASPSLTRKDLGLPEDKFIFLFMFDFHSTLGRKNPFALVEAFRRAFGDNNDDVLLVLKHSNSSHHPERMKLFLEQIGDCSSVHLIDGHLRKEKLQALIYSCDCYVSLHRSEGFGLTMAEAMYYDKPVIATGYSSTLEFMNVGNSYLVEYDIITANETDGSYPKGSVWADANVAHAARLMQQMFEDREQAKLVGERGGREVRTLLSPQNLGKKIKKRLNYVFEVVQQPGWQNRMQRLDRDFALVTSENANQLPTFTAGALQPTGSSKTKRRYFEFQAKAWEKTANRLIEELNEFQILAERAKLLNVPVESLQYEELVEYCYRLLFGQEPSQEEITYWLQRMHDENITIEAVVDKFFKSVKFREFFFSDRNNFKIHGESANKYLCYCYRLLLDREPDEEGLHNWLTVVNDRDVDRRHLLKRFMQSGEFHNKKPETAFLLRWIFD